MLGTRLNIAVLAVASASAQPPVRSVASLGQPALSQDAAITLFPPLAPETCASLGSQGGGRSDFGDTVINLPGRHFWPSTSVSTGLDMASTEFSSRMRTHFGTDWKTDRVIGTTLYRLHC